LIGQIDPRLIAATGDFAFHMLRELAAEERGKNLFFSPLSILLALAMTYNGAEADTKDAMAEALHFPPFALDALNRGFRDLAAAVVEADRDVEINIANSIWYRLGFEAEEDFIGRNQAYYRAEVRGLDFSEPGAEAAINDWIGEATRGRIQGMLDAIPRDAVMYLVNALYFKGEWTHPFPADRTREGEFTLEDGTKKMVPMMHAEEELPHQRAEDLEILRLPYGWEKFAMYIILPGKGARLEEILGRLDGASWKELVEGMEEKAATVAMPRYRVEYEKHLEEVLTRMGMGIAFGPCADFSGIAPGLYISFVLHKALILVDETGSEAAAATVVGAKTGLPAEQVVFTVDQPFLFVITDDRTGGILFMGRVADP
jgi:serpin B